MSTERDELAGLLSQHTYDRHRAVCNCSDLVQVGLRCDDETHAQHMASTILSAGYTKPRQVTTVEELDALPAEVVVRSSVGVVWEKYADDYSDGDGVDFWQQVGVQRMYASSKVTLPATVLYSPVVCRES